MKFIKIILISILIINFSCINNKNNRPVKEGEYIKSENTENCKKRPIKQENELISFNDSIKDKFYTDINKNIDKHSLKLNKLFKNKIVSLGIKKINLKTDKNILISSVHNIGTFDEMILITHDLNLNLIDSLYVGTTTMFDNGKSHTIETEIANDNEIIFHHIDWGYISEEDIDTIKYEKNTFTINTKGQIIKK